MVDGAEPNIYQNLNNSESTATIAKNTQTFFITYAALFRPPLFVGPDGF
jgi:hypothetical protein